MEKVDSECQLDWQVLFKNSNETQKKMQEYCPSTEKIAVNLFHTW